MRPVAILALGLAATAKLLAADEAPVNPHLSIFQPLLGKTLKGEFTGSTPAKPVIDVQHWERALNGQAVRVQHSINNGVYGGETLFIWDPKQKTVSYYYFTTAGFMTTGTIETNDQHFVAHETVSGDAGGPTEVRSTSEFLPGGKFHVKAEYLENGKWTFGHEVTYGEDPSSHVVYK
jgi:hypothetical protein